MIPKSVIKKAVSEASRSDVLRGKIGAVLYNNSGHIITSAHNSAFLGSKRFRTIHAEEALLNKAYKIRAINRFGRDLNVLVVRLRLSDGQLGIAKPCVNCQRALRSSPFTIYYSTNSQTFEEFNLTSKP
jgi:tRNA(Arg) A34 adenosine deaminase TadA